VNLRLRSVWISFYRIVGTWLIFTISEVLRGFSGKHGHVPCAVGFSAKAGNYYPWNPKGGRGYH